MINNPYKEKPLWGGAPPQQKPTQNKTKRRGRGHNLKSQLNVVPQAVPQPLLCLSSLKQGAPRPKKQPRSQPTTRSHNRTSFPEAFPDCFNDLVFAGRSTNSGKSIVNTTPHKKWLQRIKRRAKRNPYNKGSHKKKTKKKRRSAQSAVKSKATTVTQ